MVLGTLSGADSTAERGHPTGLSVRRLVLRRRIRNRCELPDSGESGYVGADEVRRPLRGRFAYRVRRPEASASG